MGDKFLSIKGGAQRLRRRQNGSGDPPVERFMLNSDNHIVERVVSAPFLHRIAGLHPGLDAAGIAVDVFIAQLHRPHGPLWLRVHLVKPQ